MNNYKSNMVSVSSGVPQASLLGPLLFAIYVNDIGQCIHSLKLLCFGDDMKILKKVSSTEDMLTLHNDLTTGVLLSK